MCHQKEAHYLEAQALDMDVERKEIVCQGSDGRYFKVGYDICIIAVGATNQTFGRWVMFETLPWWQPGVLPCTLQSVNRRAWSE